MKILILLSFLSLIGCASGKVFSNYQVDYQKDIEGGFCEAAQSRIPLEKDSTKFLRLYQGSLGYLVYVPTLPISLGLDVILMSRCRLGCAPIKEDELLEHLFPTTAFNYETTKDQRCPDTRYYIQKFLEIVNCYQGRKDPDSLKNAISLLDYLVSNYEGGLTCIGKADYNLILDTRNRLTDQLGKLICRVDKECVVLANECSEFVSTLKSVLPIMVSLEKLEYKSKFIEVYSLPEDNGKTCDKTFIRDPKSIPMEPACIKERCELKVPKWWK